MVLEEAPPHNLAGNVWLHRGYSPRVNQDSTLQPSNQSISHLADRTPTLWTNRLLSPAL